MIGQMNRNHAVLPPIHFRLVQWCGVSSRRRIPRRRRPYGPHGKPLPPPTDGTCLVADRDKYGVVSDRRRCHRGTTRHMQRVTTGDNGRSRVLPVVPTLSLQCVLEFPPIGEVDIVEAIETNAVASY